MKKVKTLFLLFISMLKIGLFTFGGGYAMIHLLENEFVSKKKWIDQEEFLDLVTIAESTPGPIAINCATYIGYKKERFLGAIFSTLGMITPSFLIIYLISLFFNQFLSIAWVASAFKGIQVCVIFLILSAGLKMLKKIKKTPFSSKAVKSTSSFALYGPHPQMVSFLGFIYFLVSARRVLVTLPVNPVLLLSQPLLQFPYVFRPWVHLLTSHKTR